MDDFERALGRTQDTLGRGEQRLRRTLERLDVDTSGLGTLREMRGWIETNRPDLRRRSATIRAEQTVWGASSGPPAGLTAFDESRYGKSGADPHVYAAAGALAKAGQSGEVDAKTLAELEKRTGDPAFAAALLTAMGAAGYRGLLAKTAGKDDKETTRLQAALGKMLGTAGSRVSDTWRDQLTADLKSSRDARAALLALKHSTFPADTLLSAARKIYDWVSADEANKTALRLSGGVGLVMPHQAGGTADGKHTPAGQMFPMSVENQAVLSDLLEVIGRQPAVAQDFLTGNPAILPHLLGQDLNDGGKRLGKALEAATLTFRDRNGTPQNPSRGYLSAQLASRFIHLEAQRIDKGQLPNSFVAPASTGRILAGYINDINHIARRSDEGAETGVRGDDNPSVPGRDPWGAIFNKRELQGVMQEAFTDHKAFAPVLAAQTAFTGRLLDHGAAGMAAGRGSDTLMANAQQVGAGFGLITDAAGLAKIQEGKELDEAQQRNLKLLMAAVNTGLAIPQAGTWPITAGVVGAWTGLIEDSAKGDAETKARSEANAAVDQTRNLLHDLTAQAMLKHGLFGSAEPPADTHPWASLEDLRPGDDPRANPNNFLKDDGRTLMTKDEMIDNAATNSTDKYRRFNAYVRWLYQGPAGKPWLDVEIPLNQKFSDGFARYGS